MAGDRNQIHVWLEENLLQQLDDFRFAQRFPSRAGAIRWLLEWSLSRNARLPKLRHKDAGQAQAISNRKRV